MIRTWKGIAIALSGDGPVMDVRTAWYNISSEG